MHNSRRCVPTTVSLQYASITGPLTSINCAPLLLEGHFRLTNDSFQSINGSFPAMNGWWSFKRRRPLHKQVQFHVSPDDLKQFFDVMADVSATAAPPA